MSDARTSNDVSDVVTRIRAKLLRFWVGTDAETEARELLREAADEIVRMRGVHETSDELARLRKVEEAVERVACWVNPNDVYQEIRRMRDDIYEAREARRRAVKTSADDPRPTLKDLAQ